MKITVNEFKGIMPKVSNDKLPEGMGQIASDCKTASGELKAISKSSADVALSGTDYQTLFEWLESNTSHWITFEGLVYAERSPVADDTFERMYFLGDSGIKAEGTITFTDGMTDNEYITIDTQTFEFDIDEDGDDLTTGYTQIGDSTTVNKYLCAETLAAQTPTANYTFIDNGDGTVTVRATSRGTAGNSIALVKSGAHISVSGATFSGGTEDGYFKAFANDIVSSPFDKDTDFYKPGADAGAAPTLAGYTGSGSDYRAYFYTYVSRYGEEGPGSDLAEVTDYASGRMQVNNIESPAVGDTHLTTTVNGKYPSVNIYRTATTGDGTADFLLVCNAMWDDGVKSYAVGDFIINSNDLYECTVAGTWATGTFVQGELVSTTILTTTNDSYLWRRCPDDLTNLRSHPNGFFVASKGNVLYCSAPFAPWAWPEDYEIPLPAQIVGLGVFGSTIVVATDGHIYTFSGPHPESLYKQRLAFQPCLSQRAVVETDLGVIFPSLEGFQLVSADGSPANVTREWFKPEDWADYEIETLHGCWYNKAYYGFYKSNEYEGNIIIDFINNTITTGNEYHWATYVSVVGGIFRTIKDSNPASSALYISRWDTSATRFRNYKFKSRRYIIDKPVNFKVAQVIQDREWYTAVQTAAGGDLEALNNTVWNTNPVGNWGYEMGGPINDYVINDQDVNGDDLYSLASIGLQDYVEFKIYVNGVLKFTKQLTTCDSFKLPRGFRDKKWEWEVTGMIPIKRVTIATSMEELRNG
jgi:hypothetical protein